MRDYYGKYIQYVSQAYDWDAYNDCPDKNSIRKCLRIAFGKLTIRFEWWENPIMKEWD